ncbi:insulin-degrading enzyme [Fomitiporia mediterranea MF3/22]|uniref:insulin-degrading enzyme n=1 Tax=Fomitiporia mediterranea (strain MF3/22) TaxID=694068 RepID=UPI000440895E|nr:insulin-degrading enzyme [Fomitiporia mediterranea MF3/22]EJD07221.1 insulin-degrading enzyme [Fomitiporia mediterranea MF3/22]
MTDTLKVVNADTTIENDAANWKLVPAKDGYPAYYVYAVPIEKSPLDDREYRVIRLENGLEVVLVHDEKTDKAAASLKVHIGHFHDPDDIPGLAHFCEHLSFMGSKEFPKENEYPEYLSKQHGYYNACTGGSKTVYFFNVASDAFEGALHRSSAFFHGPLFDASTTMREINAVDSEFRSYLQKDVWRINQIECDLARPGHPFRKFNVGCKETLTQAGWSKGDRSSNKTTDAKQDKNPGIDTAKGLETRRRVIEWWEKEYCASRMKLAVVGKESLDDLARLVTKFYSPVKNRGVDPLPKVPDDPYGKNELCKFVHVKTIKDTYEVNINFPIPWQTPHWRVSPAGFLAHIIGHEGSGSLHAYLKNKGWLNGLYAGPAEAGRGVSVFAVTVDLTKEGFKNYREVILTIFEFINLLRGSELPKWAHEELKTLGELAFRFTEKIEPLDYAFTLSCGMESPVPRALLLNAHKFPRKWDENLVREILDTLNVENCYIFVTAQDHSQIGKTGPWLTEPWYGTQYIEEKFRDDFISEAHKSNDIAELTLPKQNEFIPKDTNVNRVDVAEPKKRPFLIKRDQIAEVWHKKDDQFWVPRAQVLIIARTPAAGATVRTFVMTKLFTALITDSLNEYSYDAKLAGLSYQCGGTMRGINISIGGYNDKLHILLQRVLETIKKLDIKKDRLQVMIEQAQLDLDNRQLQVPYSLALYHLTYLLDDQRCTIEEELEALKGITVEDISEHAKQLLSQMNFLIVVNGNLLKGDALRMESMAEDVLKAKPVPESRLVKDRSRLLSKGCNYIWERPIHNPDEHNSSVFYYCHVGNYSDARTRVTCSLIDQILEEPTYDTLRTKEQLAYLIWGYMMEDVESIGWGVLIQSERDCKYLELRIENFITQMRRKIEDMQEGEFEEHKKALVHQWTEKLKNLGEESTRFWSEIQMGYYNFQRNEKDAELIKSITKQDVLNMYKTSIDPSSPLRSKISIHMRPHSPPARKFSENAANYFLEALRKAGININEEEYKSECHDEPPAVQVRAYWAERLHKEANAKDDIINNLLAELDGLIEKYPARGQGHIELDSKAVFIEDGTRFKESLELSGPAEPVEKFQVE